MHSFMSADVKFGCRVTGVSIVAIVMGLNLLEVLPLRLPSLDVDVRTLKAPPILQVGLEDKSSKTYLNNTL